MIVGIFRDGFPRVLLTLHGAYGSLGVECVVDSAYNGYLTLPDDVLRRLGVSPADAIQVKQRLADGSVKYTSAYTVILEWEGELRDVEALAEENNPLLGTAAFLGCRVTMDAEEGGEVVIEPLD